MAPAVTEQEATFPDEIVSYTATLGGKVPSTMHPNIRHTCVTQWFHIPQAPKVDETPWQSN